MRSLGNRNTVSTANGGFGLNGITNLAVGYFRNCASANGVRKRKKKRGKTMYDELVKALRETDFSYGCPCGAEPLCKDKDCVILQAADVIEELTEGERKA